MSRAPRFAPLLALLALGGCGGSILRATIDETTTRVEPCAGQPGGPTLAAVERALHETFSRRVAGEVVRSVHAALRDAGAASLQVQHEDHFHSYFLSYLPAARMLVFFERSADGEPDELRAWPADPAAPAAGSAAPPAAAEPGVPGEPWRFCPGCAFAIPDTGWRSCGSCGRPLR